MPVQTSDHEFSAQQEVETVMVTRPHVVVLGAGASLATCPDGDAKGIKLPLMDDLVDLLGLGDIFKPGENFEEAFSRLFDTADDAKINIVETRIRDYFLKLRLPNRPTLYDHLVLSLRDTDLIASFNWDPLLLHAYTRHKKAGLSRPRLAFLHGNVAVGHCKKDKVTGLVNNNCSKCGKPFEPSKLLFPITKKDYASDPFIKGEWESLEWGLKNAVVLTIFGYRGPRSDQEAIKTMKKAWGDVNDRSLEQTTFIVKKGSNDQEVRNHWADFVHTHHYHVYDNFYDSWIANHPRRTGEAWWHQNLEAKFIENNPIPREYDFEELFKWFSKYKGPEEKHKFQESITRL